MEARSCFCFPHFPLGGIESGGSTWIFTRSWAGWGVVFSFWPSFSCGGISWRAESQQEAVGCLGGIYCPNNYALSPPRKKWQLHRACPFSGICLMDCCLYCAAPGHCGHRCQGTEQSWKLRLGGVRHVMWGAKGHRKEQSVGASKHCASVLAREREEETVLLWPCRGSCCWIQDPCPAGDFVEQILNSYSLLLMRIQLFLN